MFRIARSSRRTTARPVRSTGSTFLSRVAVMAMGPIALLMVLVTLTGSTVSVGADLAEARNRRAAVRSQQAKVAKVRRGAEVANRTAFIHGNQLAQYGDNLITTSKYTWWSFFARSLFEQ